ncbi:MAG: DNA starvation/stationary phase protection protein [Actinomycetota bacterium]|nr:DNA starvation/stationary phase protection protein [Actinomycetota bacterium]
MASSTERSDSVPTVLARSRNVSSSRRAAFTVPTLSGEDGALVAETLQQRLVGLLDLALTLKHIHWNVVGSHFISVHEMLDPQYQGVQTMVDDLAERIATLGGVPSVLPGRLVADRTWADYGLDRADSLSHLGALDLVYQGVIGDHRAAIGRTGDVDKVSEDLLIGQTAILEKYHWFVRSHLADWAGGMANAGAASDIAAARAVAAKNSRNAARKADK